MTGGPPPIQAAQPISRDGSAEDDIAPIVTFLLSDACRWLTFRVSHLDDSQERTTIECTVIGSGNLRPFFGFNRAKHAVLEAAILATRIGILPSEQITAELERLAILVEKTAGKQEREAFDLLRDHVAQTMSAK